VIVPSEPLAAHPLEVQIWLFRVPMESPGDVLACPIGCAVQLEDIEALFADEHGCHMEVRYAADTFGAHWPRFRATPAADWLGSPDLEVHAFAHNPPLDSIEETLFLRKLRQFVEKGTIYDLPLFAIRTAAAIAALQGSHVPVVDLCGEAAVICYEAVARCHNAAAVVHPETRPKLNPATFAPGDLWELVRGGHLVYRGLPCA